MKKILETLKRKWAEYLLEILVITVGILGAFTLNNWNDRRLLRQTEYALLVALKKEFTTNKNKLVQLINLNDTNLKNASELSSFIGPSVNQNLQPKLDSLFLGALIAEVEFRPGTGTLNEIISAGKLEAFQNDSLRSALSMWDGAIKSIRFQESQEYGRIRIQILDLWNKTGNTKSTAYNAGLRFLPPSKFSRTSISFYSSIELDNLLAAYILTGTFLNNYYYNSLNDEIVRIISLLDSELARFQ